MKNNFNELRAALVTDLKTVKTGINVHYLYFPKPPEYPYIVFDPRRIDSGESGKMTYQLDIDIVGRNMYQVTEITDKVMKKLDHEIVSTTKFLYHVYSVSAQPMIEDDKGIFRIRVRADLYFYSKEE